MTQARAQGRLSPLGGDPCTQRGGRRHRAAAGTSLPEADLRDLLPFPLHSLPDFELRLADWRLAWLKWGVEGLNAMGSRGRAPARARGSSLQLQALSTLAARVSATPDCRRWLRRSSAPRDPRTFQARHGRFAAGAVWAGRHLRECPHDGPRLLGMHPMQPDAFCVEAAGGFRESGNGQ